MKKNLISIYKYLLPFLVLSIPASALALQPYTLLVPSLPGIGKGGVVTFPEWLPGAFNLTIGIAAGLAFIMITFGGILYATSDAVGTKNEGRGYITNAIIGLLFVIGAWVILNTINPEILKFAWTIPIPKADYTLPSVLPGTPATVEDQLADAQVRARLEPAISINHPNMCTAGQTTGCTSLNGLGEAAIQGLLSLKSSAQCSACSITITGGTEAGHLSHGVGKPVVDLSRNAPLDAYIIQNAVQKVDTKLGPAYTVPLPNGNTAVFLDERVGSDGSADRHWHVSF